MSSPSLFYRELGSGNPLIILHGVFGSSDNWMTIARNLEKDYKLFVLDQRNHGQSFHSDEFDYPHMVEDLKHFIEEHEIEAPVILGHSMGGKVAMSFAVKYPSLLRSLVVVDISPRSYPIHHDEILTGLASIDLDSLTSRNEADKQLAKFVSDGSIRNFLLKNLARDEDGKFIWRLNLPIIRMKIERVGVGLGGEAKFNKRTLFIRGALSNYIEMDDYPLITERFPMASIETIEGAGHWVHAEKPELFLQVCRQFLES